MHVKQRGALQAALRGVRTGQAILQDARQEDSPAGGILSLIEGELLDLLGAPPAQRRFDRGPLGPNDPSPHAG